MKRGSSYLPGDGGGSGGKSGGINCNIVLLDGREVQQEIKKKTTGQWIFDYVSGKLGITERNHFGLLYEDEQKCQQWLDVTKPVKKQIKKNNSKVFYCVRLYPTDPLSVNESTRIQLYWQLKRDFTSGRLPCLNDTSLKLVSLMAQVEIGDWTGQPIDYKTRLNLLKDEFTEQQSEISDRHQHFRGTSEMSARAQFLKIVSLLDFYGMVFYDVRYGDKVPYMLGMSPFGMALCKKMKIVQSYNWSRVVQVLYRGRRFIVRVTGEWVGKNKYQQLSFEVDSSKTCKDLYSTFVEHINFYTRETDDVKSDHKDEIIEDPMKSFANRISLSSSNEDLRKQLLIEGKKAAEERLHRSLSLPRRTKNQVNVQSLFQPPSTNTTTNDPVLDAFRARRVKERSQSVSPPNSTNDSAHQFTVDALRRESEPNSSGNNGTGMDSLAVRTSVFLETQSMVSHDPMGDSLLDLANDLGDNNDDDVIDGNEDDELVIQELESSPGRKHRSSSLPHINEVNVNGVVVDDVDRITAVNGEQQQHCDNQRIHSISEEKLQNRKLVLSWVKEQKKKDQAKVLDSTNTKPLLPVLKKTSSGGEPSRSNRYMVKTKWSPTTERPSSSFLPRMTLSEGSAHPYDIYDVPRPSPIPSLFNIKRITQCSASAHSSLHSVSLAENDYDVPRSLIDLRGMDSPCLRSVTSSTKPSSYSINSHTSSSSEPMSQLAMLKDAYPDYDIPKPAVELEVDPEYDVPRSIKPSLGMIDAKSDGNVSFGDLDKMMAEIDSEVIAVTSDNQLIKETEPEIKEAGSNSEADTKKGETIEEVDGDGGEEGAGEHVSDVATTPNRTSTNSSHDRLPSVLPDNQQSNIIDSGIRDDLSLDKRVLRSLLPQPSSLPLVGSNPRKTTDYDRFSAIRALEKLTQEGIIPSDLEERKKLLLATSTSVDENENPKENNQVNETISPQSQQLKLEELLQGRNQPNHPQKLPFDPNFFARQTAFEQSHSQQQWKQLNSQHSSKQESVSSQEEMRTNAATTRSSENIPASKKTEPIYQEITDMQGAGGNNHRSQKSWSGSRNNISYATTTQRSFPSSDQSPDGTRHKRTFSGGDLLSVKQRPTTSYNSGGGGAGISAGGAKDGSLGSSLDRLKWQTSSGRYHHRMIEHEESIPGSPSFYTKNPEASTVMPPSNPDTMSVSSQFGPLPSHTQHQSKHFFRDHLNNLDSNPQGGHNRVMNWMQQFDAHGPPPSSVSMTPVISSVAPLGSGYRSSVPMSQSVHSQLNRVNPLPHPSVPDSNGKFKDHLYEDLEQMKSAVPTSDYPHQQAATTHHLHSSNNSWGTSLPRLRSMTYSTNHISTSGTTLPYVTRELPSSKPGATMYATDV